MSAVDATFRNATERHGRQHNGWIVNLGAALIHPAQHKPGSNTDLAWNMFFASTDLHIIAYEGSKEALALNDAEFAKPHGPFHLTAERRSRVVVMREFVNAYTITEDLARRGVPVSPLLLKVDIDSFDLQATAKILERFTPRLIWVEASHFFGISFRFSALGVPPDAPTPGYGCGPNFCCLGASRAMWIASLRRRGYSLLQWDHNAFNLLFVQHRHRHHFPWRGGLNDCFNDTHYGVYEHRLVGLRKGAETPAAWANAISRLNRKCALGNIPYTFETDTGECCPRRLGSLELNVTNCFCLDMHGDYVPHN